MHKPRCRQMCQMSPGCVPDVDSQQSSPIQPQDARAKATGAYGASGPLTASVTLLSPVSWDDMSSTIINSIVRLLASSLSPSFALPLLLRRTRLLLHSLSLGDARRPRMR